MNTTTRPLLAIDPGLNVLGVAVMEADGNLRHAAVLTTPRRLAVDERLSLMRSRVAELLRLYRPALVVLEQTWPSQNKSLAIVHRVNTVCARLARARGTRIVRIPSTTVRRHVTGFGWAGKQQVAHVIAARYRELGIYLSQDRAWKERHFGNLFDAVALASWAVDTGIGRSFRTPRHRNR